MDDTDKWASGIINELFQDVPHAGIAKDGEVIKEKNKEREYEICAPDGDLISSKFKFSGDDINEPRNECLEKSDVLMLSSNKYLNSNERIYESLHTECNNTELLSHESHNGYMNSIVNQNVISSDKDLTHEDLFFNTEMSKIINDTAEIKTVRDTLNDILDIVEGKNIENNDKSVAGRTDSAPSTSFKSDFDENIFPIDETKILNEIDECISLVLETKNFIVRKSESKLNNVKLRRCRRLARQNKESELGVQYSALVDRLTHLLCECFHNNSGFKTKNDNDESKKKEEDEIRNVLKIPDMKEINFPSEDLDVKSTATKSHKGEDARNQFSGECSEEKYVNKRVHSKEEYEIPKEEIHGDFDITYKNFEDQILKPDVIENFGDHGNSPDGTKNYLEDDFYPFIHRNQNISLDENDDEEEIIQRIDNVIRIYRNACVTIENLFVRPFAILISESADLLIFTFFLGICIFYILYEKIFRWYLRIRGKQFDTEKENDMDDDCCYCSCLSTNTLNCETSEKNEKNRESDEMNSFTSETEFKNSDQLKDSTNFLSVNPEDVLIIDTTLENVKPNIEYIYKKCEYFEFCPEKKFADVVNLHENSIVDILYNACDEDCEINARENEFDMEIIASSLRPECRLYGSNIQSSNISQIWQKKSSECQEQISSIANSSNSKLFSNVLDLDGCILNSTVVGDSAFIMNESRNSHDIKSLYNIEDSVNCISVRVPKEQVISNYSMNVNLSFSSRSDMDKGKSSSLNNEVILNKEWCNRSSKNYKISKELKMARGDEINSTISLNSSSFETSENKEMDEPTVSVIQKAGKFIGHFQIKNLKTVFPRYRKGTFQNNSKRFDDSGTSSTVTSNVQNTFDAMTDTSSVSDKAVTHSKNFNANTSTEFDSLVEDKNPKSGDSPKRKSNFKRRISEILNNWKSRQVMQCVSANPRRKYKKHTEVA